MDDRALDALATAQIKFNTLLGTLSHLLIEAAPPDQVQQFLGLLTELQTVAITQQQHYNQFAVQYQALLEQCWHDQQLIQITQRLRQSLNPSEILDQAVAAVQQLLRVDGAVIYQFRVNAAVAVAESVPTPDWLMQSITEPLAARELAQFCQQVGVVVLDQPDTAELPPALLKLAQQQTKALLAVPIWQEGNLLGIVVAYQHTEKRSWQPYEIDLLQQLATEIAVALHHSERYQQTQQLTLDLEQQVQYRTEQLKNALNYESMLKRVTDRVRDSLDEHDILQAAMQELTTILQLAGCNAALYDLNQGISTIQYEYTQSIPASQGRVAQMEHFPEIYQQLRQGWYFQFCSLLPNPARGRVAMLACPIFVDPQSSQGIEQSVLGDLWLIHAKDHMFDEFEIRLVQQVANQCAIAIRQARLYQAAQVQVQELAKLNQLKDEFLSTVSHELRTPITNVRMAIQMLRNAPSEEKRKQYLSILEQEATREANLINDLLDLQQLQATPQPIEPEVIVLHDWLPKLIEPFQPRFAARQQKFQVHYPVEQAPIASELSSLRRILAELLNNACKYTAPKQRIDLTVEYAPDTVIFKIGNQAVIPEVELSKIFDKFYRCPNADPWQQGGTGLGLALVQKLVERLQGTMQVTSSNGWTQFTIQLPSLLNEALRS